MDGSASVKPDPAMTALHLDLLFRGTAGYVPIRILQEKDGVPFRKVLPFILNDVELVTRVTPLVLKAAAAGAASFVVPATVQKPGSAKKADISQMTCLLVDLDTGDVAAARAHLEAHLGQASLIVMSGGVTDTGQSRLHLYWRLTAVVSGSDLTRLCELRGILAAKVGGDTSFASPHQPIRLAGSIYAKSGLHRLVQIVNTCDQIYALQQIDKAVCEMPTLAGIAAPAFSIATGVKGPSASDLKLRKIRADGQDEVTRFAAVGKVIGHWLHVVRSGRITMAHAWEQVQNHNAACIDPPWTDTRLRESFDALLKRDVKTHGQMPDLGQFSESEPGADGSAGTANEDSGPQTLPEAVFLSEDDLADRFVTRFRSELRFVPARGAWMRWTGQLWKQDETSLATDRIRMICRVAADMLSDEKMARKLCSERTIAAVGKLARTDPRIAEPGSAWDRGEMIINTPAGTLDLATGEMRPHSSGDLLTRITSASVGQNCPRWLRFIDEVTGGKPGLADYLQRVA
jgi:putative DNA primase/helicase